MIKHHFQYQLLVHHKGVGKQIGFRIENPNLSIASSLVEGLTNFPMARIQHKMNNLEEIVNIEKHPINKEEYVRYCNGGKRAGKKKQSWFKSGSTTT